MGEPTIEQPLISQEAPEKKNKASHLAPWQFKKGQSGNPKGRHPGKSMKEFAKEYLASLTDDERLEYFEGMNKSDIWKMAEGNPQTDVTSKGEKLIPVPILSYVPSNNSNPQDSILNEANQSDSRGDIGQQDNLDIVSPDRQVSEGQNEENNERSIGVNTTS